jgi:O-antigen ligase
MALAALLLVTRLISERRRVALHTAGLLAILLWAVAWLASGLHGGRLISLSGAALLTCLVAATVLPRGRGACLGIGLFGVSVAIASGALATFNFGLASVPCRHTCVLGAAVTGVLPNENLLGTTLLASLPFVYLGFRGPARVWLLLYVAGMAFTSGSRGAILTAATVVIAVLLVRPRLDGDRPAPARTAMAGALLAGALLVSAYVAQHDWSPTTSTLNERPALWRVASDYVDESPLVGYGPDRWETLYKETGEIPQAAEHSTHNQWMDVLFRTGWVGVLLLVGMMVAMLWSAGSARPAVLIVLATVFMIGIGERTWQIGAFDFVSFSLIGAILMGPARAEPRPRPAPRPAIARRKRLVAVPSG